jgi:hypothetical protein
MRREGKLERFETVNFSEHSTEDGEFAEFHFVREGRGGSRIRIVYSMSMLHDALWIRLQGENLARPDGGMHSGLSMPIHPGFEPARLLHDHPYGVSEVAATRDFVRKYPTGDWMTSPQVFEDVKKPFTAHTFVDLLEGQREGHGLLVVHDGSQQFFRDKHGVRPLLSMYDPWDGEHFDNVFDAELWLVPHGAMSNTERARLSMECNLGSPRFEDSAPVAGGGDVPPLLGALTVDCPNVLATAFYRERSARGAARRVRRGGGGCDAEVARADRARGEDGLARGREGVARAASGDTAVRAGATAVERVEVQHAAARDRDGDGGSRVRARGAEESGRVPARLGDGASGEEMSGGARRFAPR